MGCLSSFVIVVFILAEDGLEFLEVEHPVSRNIVFADNFYHFSFTELSAELLHCQDNVLLSNLS